MFPSQAALSIANITVAERMHILGTGKCVCNMVVLNLCNLCDILKYARIIFHAIVPFYWKLWKCQSCLGRVVMSMIEMPPV